MFIFILAFMQARKHRKIGSVTQSNRQPSVSRKNFNNLIETESEKTGALLQLSEAVERGNAIKEKELELLQMRNALKEKELELLEKKNQIEQERNQIFATFTDNFAIVSQNFYDIFKNK